MTTNSAAWMYVFASIAFTVYGQFVVKWRVDGAGAMPAETLEKVEFLARLMVSPWMLTVWIAAALAAVSWMAAMTTLELSVAYPFMSLTFVAVLALSPVLLGEAFHPARAVGVALIVLGVVVGSRVPS